MPVNWNKFSKAVRKTRTQKSIGVRSAAKQSGLSTATFSRAENGKSMSADLFVDLCAWMKIDPIRFRF